MNKKFEDIIAEKGKLVYTSAGDSMYPLIQKNDLLVIEAVKKPLSVNDVPLYKRDSGQYVLHRIVDIKRGKYVMKGDNRTAREKGITDRQIIGVLTGIIRGGVTLPVETPGEHKKRVAKDFIYLLSCSANSETPDAERVARMDLASIYRLSKLHMLCAAAAFAIEQVTELPHAFDQAKKKAIRKLSLFEIERVKITAEFAKAGIWYMALKGILIKNCYPKSAMREMTDNDLLVDSTRMNDVKEIMLGLGYTCDSFGVEHHDTYSKPPTIQFEIHHSLFDAKEFPEIAGYYSGIKKKAVRNGFELSLSDEDFFVYFVGHTYKHYGHGGTGLRSLLDVYLFLKTHPGLDEAYLKTQLELLGISKFEQKIKSLANKVFTGAELSEKELDELDYFIESGSNGVQEHNEYNRIRRKLSNDDSSDNKRKYLLRRVFISGKALEVKYPFFAKHKALYPFLFVYRPVMGVLSHPGKLIDELKRVKSFKAKE